MKKLAIALLFTPFLALASASDGNPGGFYIGDSISQKDIDVEAFKKSGLPMPTADTLNTYSGIVLLKPKSEAELSPFKTLHTNMKNGKLFELMAANDELDPKSCQEELNKLTQKTVANLGTATEYNANYTVWRQSKKGLRTFLQCQGNSLLLIVGSAI